MATFLEIEYTGLHEGNVFDKTEKPVTICVGEGQVVSGLDEALKGRKEGESFKIELEAEKAFGKKDAKLIKLVPMNIFKKQNIAPQPGLAINVDGSVATILRVSGGRVLVDFNHPMAGKDISYDVKVLREVNDTKTKVESYLNMILPIEKEVEVSDGGKVEVKLKGDIPKEVTEPITRKLKEIAQVSEVKFSKKHTTKQ